MAKGSTTLLVIALTCTLLSKQAVGQVSGKSQLDLMAPFVGNTLTCSQSQPQTIVVPKTVASRAKLKARLANLLRESLFDDANGIVNVERENEIRKLAGKLQDTKADFTLN